MAARRSARGGGPRRGAGGPGNALDDYSQAIPSEDWTAYPVLVATRRDGKLLADELASGGAGGYQKSQQYQGEGTQMRIWRRIFTASALPTLAIAGALFGSRARAVVEIEDVRELKPGQFVWYPERAAAGPVAIVVSLPDQLVYVYRNGIRIGVSTCATGRPGHATPTGVFTILQKDKTHHSSLYNDASMPFTERLTWSGVALHAGNLPGYPDSHGCVHLPLEFSELLFQVTQLGTPVIIADDATAPAEVLHPGLLWNAAIEEIQSVEPSGGRAPWPRLREGRSAS
jgi:hypothetical protein